MIRIIGLVLTLGGAIALTLGILGLFQSVSISLNPWALTILGGIFFLSGISILRFRKDPNEKR